VEIKERGDRVGVTTMDVKKTIGRLSDLIIQNEVPFCELDSAAGDGDFGTSLAKGFKEVKLQLDDIDDSSVQTFLRDCSMIIMEYCGGASGPIWGSAFRAAALAAKGKEELEPMDIAALFDAAVTGIQKRGGAKLGDKTLLDALIPATEAMKQAAQEGAGVRPMFERASMAAAEGAEATKGYAAAKGRASYLGERSISHPDAGAMAVSILFAELLK